VANLLTRSALHQPSAGTSVALLGLIGGMLGPAGFLVRTRRRRFRSSVRARLEAIAVLAAIACAHTVLTYVAFRDARLLLPIVVPVLFQLPTALILGLLAPPVQYVEHSRAVCLITDAAESTAIGQHIPHRDYTRLMDEYNDALSRPARAYGGEVLPPQGDGFVCLWCLPAERSSPVVDAATRQKACLAALAIKRASEEFNRSRPHGQRLVTRIGLTIGSVTLFFNTDRGLFEALGDPINVASRVRDLNVAARTSILAAEAVIEGLDGVVDVKPVHVASPLKGVDHPIAVYELRAPAVIS
jgi:class 3 adenylate cyclase